MGNTTEQMLEKAVELIGDTLNEVGHKVETAKAVERFKEKLLAIV